MSVSLPASCHVKPLPLYHNTTESIYLLGGRITDGNETSGVGRYSLRQDTWQSAPPLMNARCCLSAVAVNDETIAVCGGYRLDMDLSSCELFSTITQRFTAHHKCI